jgi:predicted secreted Zn-dependent protease
MDARHFARIALMAAAALAVAACTSTESRITTTFYTIRGDSGADLDREIAAKGPLKGHALASAAIKFVPVAVSYDESDGKCAFREAKFRIEAEMTLPRWQDHRQSSDPELRNAWKNLADYARQHEEHHVAIAEKYAAKIGTELKAISAKPDCDALDAAAQRVLKRNKRDHNREQLAFDAAEQKRLSALFD